MKKINIASLLLIIRKYFLIRNSVNAHSKKKSRIVDSFSSRYARKLQSTVCLHSEIRYSYIWLWIHFGLVESPTLSNNITSNYEQTMFCNLQAFSYQLTKLPMKLDKILFYNSYLYFCCWKKNCFCMINNIM